MNAGDATLLDFVQPTRLESAADVGRVCRQVGLEPAAPAQSDLSRRDTERNVQLWADDAVRVVASMAVNGSVEVLKVVFVGTAGEKDRIGTVQRGVDARVLLAMLRAVQEVAADA